MVKKESRQFNISVEGVNCETMYFVHLAKLINNSGRNNYNLKVNPKKMTPMEYAKRNAYRPVDNKKNGENLPYFHIQDIEDYYDDFQRKKFFGIIKEMRTAEKEFGITYELGYSNYTFELWMLLHVADVFHFVQHRRNYLSLINRHFNKNYSVLDDFKQREEFSSILDEFITLDSIKDAISRAERILEINDNLNKVKEEYGKFAFCRDNPDISVHKVVRTIFDVRGVK